MNGERPRIVLQPASWPPAGWEVAGPSKRAFYGVTEGTALSPELALDDATAVEVVRLALKAGADVVFTALPPSG